jgi:uncharacterized membrane protein
MPSDSPHDLQPTVPWTARDSDARVQQVAAALAWTGAEAVGIGSSVLVLFGPHGALSTPWSAAAHPGLVILAATVGVAVIAGLATWRRRHRDGAPSVTTLYLDTIRRCALLAGLPIVATLRQPIESAHQSLVLGLASIGGALCTYTAYQWTSDRDAPIGGKKGKWAAVVALVLVTALYATVATRIAWANHMSFNTGRADLGYYLSIFRQSSQGIPLGCSVCGGGSHLTGHFDPILVLLSPLFLLYPWAETLLLLQAVWLASGSLPVYLLALRHVRHRGAALALAVAYLAYPALHGVNFFDFHSVALCIPLFVWLLYLLPEGAAWAYYLTLAGLLLVREDISLATSLVGIHALFTGTKTTIRRGWVTILLSAVYFVGVKGALMGRVDPLNTAKGAAGGYAYFYEALIPAGHSTAALLGTLITDPLFVLGHIFTDDKVDFMAALLGPLLALPLLGRGKLMLAYGCALTLLASRPFLFSIHFQYTSLLIPFLFVLTADGLGRIRRGEVTFGKLTGERLARALAFGVMISTVLASWKLGGLVHNASFQGGFRPLYDIQDLALDAWLKKVGKSLPRGATVAGNSRLITHLGIVTSIRLIEMRRASDYVVANVKAPPTGATILAEAARGELQLLSSYEHFHLYRTRYKNRSTAADLAAAPEKP